MSGQIDETTLRGKDPFMDANVDRAVEETARIRARMSPEGALGLPPLLDSRRLEWGLTDAAFDMACAFDRIFVWQLPKGDGQRYGDTLIHLTETGKSKERESAPRGILVSAGLHSLDCLRSNGIDLGHIVGILRLAPYRIVYDIVAGKPHYLMVMRVGDITGSEDLRREIRSGKVTLCRDEDGRHFYEYSSGTDPRATAGKPQAPFIGDDY